MQMISGLGDNILLRIVKTKYDHGHSTSNLASSSCSSTGKVLNAGVSCRTGPEKEDSEAWHMSSCSSPLATLHQTRCQVPAYPQLVASGEMMPHQIW